jgi:uncharacterized protein YfaS (alpha-2-macroglobulin family)
MAELLVADDPDVVIASEGTGRLYYRLGLRYAPASLSLDPRDEGFVVSRIYEAVDDPDAVTRDDDGTWRIAAGSEVRVRLSLVADARRTNMVLVDPLPAGLEAVNPTLPASPATLPDEQGGGEGEPIPLDGGGDAAYRYFAPSWWGPWYDHQNLRDDRVEAYSGHLPAGVYEYSYVARATTPGTFVVPPPLAQEIYAPEVFGRGSTDRVVVE